jgi:hypothetical protein
MSDREMNMSDQAVGAVMMALQKSLLEQSDIVPVLSGFRFRLSEVGLMVMNPPLVKLNEETEENLQQSFEYGGYDEQLPETD